MAWALAAGTKYILQIGSSSETTLKPHWRGQHSCCLLKSLPFARSVSSVTLTLWVFVRVSSSRGRQKCYKVEPHLREQGQTISSFTTLVSLCGFKFFITKRRNWIWWAQWLKKLREMQYGSKFMPQLEWSTYPIPHLGFFIAVFGLFLFCGSSFTNALWMHFHSPLSLPRI